MGDTLLWEDEAFGLGDVRRGGGDVRGGGGNLRLSFLYDTPVGSADPSDPADPAETTDLSSHATAA